MKAGETEKKGARVIMEKLKSNGVSRFFLMCDLVAIATIFVFLTYVNFSAERFVLILLPFFYILINLTFVDYGVRSGSFIAILIRSMAFLRMVLLPLSWTKNIEMPLFVTKGAVIAQHYRMAVFLLIYEYFSVRVCMWIYYTKYSKKDENDSDDYKSTEIHYNYTFFRIVIPILVIFAIAATIAYPQLWENYKTILTLDVLEFTSVTSVELSGGFFVRVIDTLFTLDIRLLRILLPTHILYEMSRQKHDTILIHITVLLFTVLQFMVLSSTFAEAIVADFVFVYFYLQLYPERRRPTLLILTISTFGMILVFFVVRYTVENGGYLSRTDGVLYYFSQVLNSYFEGIDNVSATMNIPRGYEFEGVLASIIRAIPFNSTIFGNTEMNMLTLYYNEFNDTDGQIIPTIGAGYYCLGSVLAPLFSVLFTYYAIKYDDKARNNKNNLMFVSYFFCAVVCGLGVGAKSPSITLRWLLSWGFFLVLITCLSSKQRIQSGDDGANE